MQVKYFNGLNNVGDTLGLGLSWLKSAENINITAGGKIERCAGYALVRAGSMSGAYATEDHERGYFVDGGSLKAWDGSTLRTGLNAAEMRWTEVNGQVFYTNGVDSGVILPDNTVADWAWPVPATPALAAVTGSLAAGLYRVLFTFTLADGRDTGPGDTAEILLAEGQGLQIAGVPQIPGLKSNVYIAPANSPVFSFADSPLGGAMVWNTSPDNLGMDLQTFEASPLPPGDVVQAWRGRVYVALFDGEQTVIWFSQALGFHLFNLASDFIVVPGRVLMLAPHALALLIGTDKAVHAYDGSTLSMVANYGVVPGKHWARSADGRVLFWSLRGLCAALPFANLTSEHVSVAPGLHAGGAVLETDGATRYVVALQQGGTAFNPRD